MTRTVRPVWVHSAFHPLLTLCHVVGQVNVSVQPFTGAGPLFVTSMEPTIISRMVLEGRP